MDLRERISDYMDEKRDEFLADLARLVAVKSVKGEAAPRKPFGEGPAAALDAALEICRGHGFAVKDYDGYVGTADLNGGPTALDILAHLDVVGEGGGWDTNPYEAVVKDDGCVYGRGADDDKGPLVAALYAMRCVRDLGLPLRHNARLILGTDEESGFADLAYYFAREKSAPNTFAPDAHFPVYNTEKGMYKPAFSQKWPASEALPRAARVDGGFRINVLPAFASAVVLGLGAGEILKTCAPAAEELGVALSVSENGAGGVRVAVTGRDAHASTPDMGNNGITALIRLLCLLPLADCGSTRALHALSALFPHGDGRGEALGIAMADDISGDLTVAFSLLAFSDTGLSGHLDLRTPLCANGGNCREVLEKRLGDQGFDVSGEMGKAHHTPPDSPFIQTLLGCYEAFTGEKGACLAMGGGTYVHDIRGGVAFGACFPGFVSNLHGANERAEIKSLLAAAKIYALVIAKMCGGETI